VQTSENKALLLLSGENILAMPFARIVTPLPSWPSSVPAIHDPRPKKKTWMRGMESAHDDLSLVNMLSARALSEREIF
jgi:hypothetical protein